MRRGEGWSSGQPTRATARSSHFPAAPRQPSPAWTRRDPTSGEGRPGPAGPERPKRLSRSAAAGAARPLLSPSWSCSAHGRLLRSGYVVERPLDVRRNDRRLGVINGTRAIITAIDRDHGDPVLEPAEAEPRIVRLPRSFWGAKGRRRLVLAYCRTIHKAQGATYPWGELHPGRRRQHPPGGHPRGPEPRHGGELPLLLGEGPPGRGLP